MRLITSSPVFQSTDCPLQMRYRRNGRPSLSGQGMLYLGLVGVSRSVYVPFSKRRLVFFDESLPQVRSTGGGTTCTMGRSPDILNSRSIVPADFSCSNAHSRSSSPIFPSVRLSRAANSSSSARRSRRIRRLSGAFHSPIKSNPRVRQLRGHSHLQFPPISDSHGTFASSWSVFLPRILRTLALRVAQAHDDASTATKFLAVIFCIRLVKL